jgi:uncharacterized membrane protein
MRWAATSLGVVLIFSPLLHWASAPFYALETLFGTAIIVFSAVLPSQTRAASEVPQGWSYNPSHWHHRTPVVALAFFGFFIAYYMASFQLGHFASVWDPFFGSGTRNVLTSSVAKAFPVSDAGLGAAAYLLEGLSGLIGDARRWRTMPWMVFLFFVLVVPAGVVSIVLIMLQPVIVGAWCTLCLITAITTLISIPPAVDEIFASIQFLARVHRAKRSVWKAFWCGGEDTRSPHLEKNHSPRSFNGIKFTWPLGLISLLGIWLVVSRSIIEMPKHDADVSTVIGALITTWAVLATAEPIRTIRFLIIPCGLTLFGVSFFANGLSDVATFNFGAVGLLATGLSIPRGPIKERFGDWNRRII